VGFGRTAEGSAEEARERATEVLGPDLAAQADLIVSRVAHTDEARRRWVEGHLLAGLSRRYQEQGVKLEWDESVVRWILEMPPASDHRSWERLVEERLSPALLGSLKAPGARKDVSLRVTARDGTIRVEERA
jgi:hypothetical protein